MSPLSEPTTVYRWRNKDDAAGTGHVVEAVIQPSPDPSDFGVDAIVTLDGSTIAEEHVCLGESHAKNEALVMARAVAAALDRATGPGVLELDVGR